MAATQAVTATPLKAHKNHDMVDRGSLTQTVKHADVLATSLGLDASDSTQEIRLQLAAL